MLDKNKLLEDLNDKLDNGIESANVQNLINKIESGYYDIKHIATHELKEYYEDDEDVWCK